MILHKRLLRELKQGWVKYGAMSFLLILSISLVISIAGGSDAVVYTMHQWFERASLEDGEFQLHVPLNEEQHKELQELGTEIEEKFYVDIDTRQGTILRIFKVRNKINRIDLDQGCLPTDANEIVVEKHFAQNFELKAEDTINLNGMDYQITGIGSAPDYSNLNKNIADVIADVNKFSIAFVTEEGFTKLSQNKQVIYEYAYILTGNYTHDKLRSYLIDMDFDEAMISNIYMREVVDELEDEKNELTEAINQIADGSRSIKESTEQLSDNLVEYSNTATAILGEDNPLSGSANQLKEGMLQLTKGAVEYDQGTQEFRDITLDFIEQNLNYEFPNLTSFIQAENNQRITSCEDDVAAMRSGALIAGVIVLILLAYMLTVFTVHNIERDSAIIGTLYSMGYIRKELMRHFMILPMILTLISGIAGTALGFYLIPTQTANTEAYYSFPIIMNIIPPYLLVYGIVVPLLIMLVVNYYVLFKKLSSEPLSMLRKERKQHKIAEVDLKHLGFLNRYRIRQLIMEIRGNITLFFGIFIAILLMMLGFGIYGCINQYVEGITEDVNYKYQYLLSYPMEEAPKNAEIAYTEELSAHFDMIDSDMGVVIQGIEKENPYFDFRIAGENETNEVYVSDSAAIKFQWNKGDTITLEDNTTNKVYSFHIGEIVDFASGLYVFMDIDQMRDLFEQEEDYYNTLLSTEELSIDQGRIASMITRDEMKLAAEQMYDMMSGMIVMLVSVSILLFVIIMYLLLKMIIDKSTFSISLIKVFGYTNREINKLYLGSNFYTVLITTLIALPITYKIVCLVFPVFVSNVAAGMPVVIPGYLFILMIGIILGSYIVVNGMLSRHLKKVSLTEILKDRE